MSHVDPEDIRVSTSNGTNAAARDLWLAKIRRIVDEPISPKDIPEPPVEVFPWLYLGPRRCLNDLSKLQQDIGITHVLSMNAMQPESVAQELYYTLLSKGIEHAYVPTLDILGYPLLPKHWEECGAFLQTVYDDYKCFEDGQREVESKTTETSLSVGYNQQQNSVARAAGGTHSKVFVHCEAGINRSGTIVAAAMMYFAKVPMLQAIRQLKRQRGTIMTNATFQEQLVDFAVQQKCLETE